ncbi:MAG: cysteine desulfurase NifS [Rhodothermaceae bacterium]|nr:cysteine desulfurase NifS [Rhodothermaceae bacterium]
MVAPSAPASASLLPYLDHAATTPLRPEVLTAMLPYLREQHGNPSSLHGPGRRARVAVDRAREQVADVLGAEPSEVVFTSGGTEADNAALRGVLTGEVARQTGRRGLVTSAVEHHAVLHTAQALAADGHPVLILPPDARGVLTPDALADALDASTGLVSAMLVNNETGSVNPVRELADVAHAAGAFFHTDAVQAAGLLPLDVDRQDADLLSLSAHKCGGPKGVGALYVRAGTPFAGIQTGGAQERARRGGTENVAGIVGFAEALVLAEAEREATGARLSALLGTLRTDLVAAFGDRLVIHTPPDAAPHILSVSFRPAPDPLDGEMLLAALDLDGVSVSAGSACTSGALEPSHVLLAMGVERDTAGATVRFSLGHPTTSADVADAVASLTRIVARLDAVTA